LDNPAGKKKIYDSQCGSLLTSLFLLLQMQLSVATIAGLLFGYYHLRKHLDYSLGGIISTGYMELISFSKQMVLKFKV